MSEIQIWQPQGAEIAAYQPTGPLDDWIRVADQVVRLAEVICKSPFVPDGLRNSVPATAAAILTGRELGIPPMTSLANIHVIHGKPGLSALVMRALVLGQGHEWEDVDVSNTRVMLRGRRKGSETWTTASFSTADAATAKLPLGGYPQDKLYARASARLARRAFADVIAGMPYSIEELEDGIAPDESSDVGATGPGSNGTPPAVDRPRTAQRRPRAQAPSPAAPETPRSGPAVPPSEVAAAGEGLPPLPGEDDLDPTTSGASSSARAPGSGSRAKTAEPSPSSPDGSVSTPDDTDYNTAGTVTNRQLTAIWTSLSQTYHFGPDEKDQARMVCSQILSGKDKKVELASSKDLSHSQARTVLDTLAHWKAQAEQQDDDPRGYLMLMLQAAGGPREDGEHGGE